MLIGDRINPAGRPRLAASLRAGDLGPVRAAAREQVVAGAQVLDVNVAVPGEHEPALLAATVTALQEAVTVPLSLDSADPAALEAGLAVVRGKALVNSVTATASSLRAVLPLVATHGAAVIALPLDEAGVPAEPARRVALAARILEAAEREGIPSDDVVVDALCLPLAQDPGAERALRTLRLLQRDLACATVAGVSNLSYQLPGGPAARAAVSRSFLRRAAGLSAALCDPRALGRPRRRPDRRNARGDGAG